tara:strand:+ start:1293 stop:2363 length:1071 start_codon:yes stop_codon:yes gene_type:complete
MIYFLSIVFVFCTIVFVHEFGHYMAARSVGIRVEKFYLGFNFFGLGIKKKIGDTEYGIGAFPLGGYVKVSGIIDESMDSETTGADYEYLSKTPLQQIWFSSAGVIMNLLLSMFLFSMIFYVQGIAEPNSSARIGALIDDYPADEIGLEINDLILSINEKPISNWEEMTELVQSNSESYLLITWDRNGIILSDSIKVKSEKILKNGEYTNKGIIGISPVYNEPRKISIIESVQLGFSRTIDWFFLTAQSLFIIIKGDASMDEVGGPVLIAKLAGDSAKNGGIWALFGVMAIISVNLAFINILPIPGLDGGHALISIIEGISGRKLPSKVKVSIQSVGMIILFSLIIFVIFNDIMRLL